jgi:hypothetical protein
MKQQKEKLRNDMMQSLRRFVSGLEVKHTQNQMLLSSGLVELAK